MRIYDLINSHLNNTAYYGNQSSTQTHTTTKVDYSGLSFTVDGYQTAQQAKNTVQVRDNWGRMLEPSVSYSYSYTTISGWDSNSSTISNYLSQAEYLLSLVEQIDSRQKANAAIASEMVTLRQELTGLQQRTNEVQGQINEVQAHADSIKIENAINPLVPKKKAHLLQKVWQQNDEFSKSVVSIIKGQDFDPHYVNKSKVSLVETALNSNDNALFDLLVSKGLKFSTLAKDGKTFFALVKESGKSTFMQKMVDTKQDFGKDLAKMASANDEASLKEVLELDPGLAKAKYQGYTLLQIAIKNNAHAATKAILNKDPSTVNQTGNNNITAHKVALVTGNDTALELLASKGSDLKSAMLDALKHEKTAALKQIVTAKPNILADIAQSIDEETLKDIFNQNRDAFKFYDASGKSLFHYIIAGNILEKAKTIITIDPEILKEQIDGQNVLLHVINRQDLVLNDKIEFFRTAVQAHADIPEDVQHESLNYPDICMMFEESGLMGDIGE